MKSYETSIAYMRYEMAKQTEPHRQPYLDAIEAMERLTPVNARGKGMYIVCPYCGKTHVPSSDNFERRECACDFCGQHMKWGGSADDRID